MSTEQVFPFWDKCTIYQGFTSIQTKIQLNIKKVLKSTVDKINKQLTDFLNYKHNIDVDNLVRTFLECGKAPKYYIDNDNNMCLAVDLHYDNTCADWISFFMNLDCPDIKMDIIFYNNKEARFASTNAPNEPNNWPNYAKHCIPLPSKIGGYNYMYREIFIVVRITPNKYKVSKNQALKNRILMYNTSSTDIRKKFIIDNPEIEAFINDCYVKNIQT